VRIRCRQFAFVVLGQAICIAAGLFMQQQLFGAALRDAGERRAWRALDTAAQQLQRAVTNPDPEQVDAAARHLGLTGERVVLVDRDWKPVSPGKPPTPIRFVPVPDRSDGEGTPAAGYQPAHGTFAGPQGPHLAVVWTLPDGEHRLLVHQPCAAIDELVATAQHHLLPLDFMTFLWTIVLLGLTVYLLTSRHQEALEGERTRSTSHLLRQTQEIIRTRDAVIFALAELAGSRDHETGGHLERISAYSTLIASALRAHPDYGAEVTPRFVRLIEISSVLHDIGKVGVEDSVLRKRGRLTQAEFEHMQRHTVIAGQCLGEIAQRLAGSEFLAMARDIALAHHERWDGAGYPQGLKGKQIPLAARIVAIADVYDALATTRVYKPALSHADSFKVITAGAGTQFDPELIAVVRTIEWEFHEILNRHAQSGEGDRASRFVPEPGLAEGDRCAVAVGESPEHAPEGVALGSEGGDTSAAAVVVASVRSLKDSAHERHDTERP
jgi:response regulator RpfG family c-di-GMP phosphodiesterase